LSGTATFSGRNHLPQGELSSLGETNFLREKLPSPRRNYLSSARNCLLREKTIFLRGKTIFLLRKSRRVRVGLFLFISSGGPQAHELLREIPPSSG
jgi:hypothetical protein